MDMRSKVMVYEVKCIWSMRSNGMVYVMLFQYWYFVFQLNLERATFLLNQAFDEDESENHKEAVELYSEAVELFIKIVSNVHFEAATKEFE